MARDVSTSLDMTKKVTLRALINFAEGARETPRLVTDVSVGRNAPENPTLLRADAHRHQHIKKRGLNFQNPRTHFVDEIEEDFVLGQVAQWRH
jgi:hypothetical protein